MLKRNEILALLVDWGYRSDGIPVKLFDAWTTLPAGPAALAAKSGAPIAPVAVRRLADGRFRLEIRRRLQVPSWIRPTSSGRRSGSPTRSRPRSPRPPTSGTASSRSGPSTRPRPGRSRRRRSRRDRRLVTGSAATEPAAVDAGPPARPALGRDCGARCCLAAAGLVARLPERPLVAACGVDRRPLLPRGAARRARRGRTCPRRGRSRPRPGQPAARGPRGPGRARAPGASAFRHTARYYLEVARAGAYDLDDALARLDIHDGRTSGALGGGSPVIIVGMHFGAIELPVVLLANLVGLRRPPRWRPSPTRRSRVWFVPPRADRRATRPLADARRTLLRTLRRASRRPPRRSRPDRDRHRRPAVRSARAARRRPRAAGHGDRRAELASAARRVAGGRYRCRVFLVPRPRPGPDGSAHRPSAAIAAAFEPIVADAPEQWWAPSTRSGPTWPRRYGPAASLATTSPVHAPAMPATRLGRADLHIHTLASDGTAPVTEILDHVEREDILDVIAITDHERIDAALAARRIALDRGLRTRVIVGEEISTRGGPCWGCSWNGRSPPCAASAGPSARSTNRAGSRSRRIPSSRIRCVPRASCSGACSRTRTRPSARTPWRRSTPRHSAATGTSGSSASPPSTGWPRWATDDAHAAEAIGTDC